MFEVSPSLLIRLTIVALFWGCTNPFVKKGIDASREEKKDGGFFSTLTDLRFFLPFVLNQSGSIVFFFLVGESQNVSFLSTVATALTLIFTCLTERYFVPPYTKLVWQTWVGIFFIIGGLYLCYLSEQGGDVWNDFLDFLVLKLAGSKLYVKL